MTSGIREAFCPIARVTVASGRETAKVNTRCDPETRKLLRDAIRKMAGQLSEEDLKLSDYIRLGQIGEIDKTPGKSGVLSIKAGWVRGEARD